MSQTLRTLVRAVPIISCSSNSITLLIIVQLVSPISPIIDKVLLSKVANGTHYHQRIYCTKVKGKVKQSFAVMMENSHVATCVGNIHLSERFGLCDRESESYQPIDLRFLSDIN